MKRLNLLDLNGFFFHLRDIPYVIIKRNDLFPDYHKGQDVDIFCYSIEQFTQKVLEVGNKYICKDLEIRVTDVSSSCTHIDFIWKSHLDFRFDVYQELPKFKNVNIKKHFIYSVIENAITVRSYYKGKFFEYYVPSKIDDFILRYIEYIEYYKLRPDKIKHLNYVTEATRTNPERIKFLDKLHLYTSLPDTILSSERTNLLQKIIHFLFPSSSNL